ncbi:hypothetical protein E2C01_046553 [Portunus trituberculatus]|uniref:Uncharacterized protein n=1 Tax=Portunus trituberculatus TaxID=210409 RepID=A0A5B7G558_PORTR|nr:hypothetical protein [Portunus trituberculatus]
MAASLAHVIVLEMPGGARKSASLSHIPAAGSSGSSSRSGVAPELLVLLDKRRSTLTTNQLEVHPCMIFIAHPSIDK